MYIHNDTLWPQSDQFGDTGIPFRPVIGLYLVVFIGLYLVVFIGLYLVVHLNWVSIFLGFHALGGYTQRHCPDQFGDKRLTGLLTLFGGPEPGTRISRLSLGERAAYNPISLAAVALGEVRLTTLSHWQRLHLSSYLLS